MREFDNDSKWGDGRIETFSEVLSSGAMIVKIGLEGETRADKESSSAPDNCSVYIYHS